MGMRGAEGAIDKVTVKDGNTHVHVIGNIEPKGICGSGLVDAVACMLDEEILDESGFLEDEPFEIKAPVTLTQKDIRMLQLAKSAICAGLRTLIQGATLVPADVSTLSIAGGFGSYLNTANAAKIGLLPKELAQNATAVGNAALAGASMLLLKVQLGQQAADLALSATVLDLSTSATFSDFYISGMMLDEM